MSEVSKCFVRLFRNYFLYEKIFPEEYRIIFNKMLNDLKQKMLKGIMDESKKLV